MLLELHELQDEAAISARRDKRVKSELLKNEHVKNERVKNERVKNEHVQNERVKNERNEVLVCVNETWSTWKLLKLT